MSDTSSATPRDTLPVSTTSSAISTGSASATRCASACSCLLLGVVISAESTARRCASCHRPPMASKQAPIAAAVAIAFADSSIVVLALPQLYGRFHTSIEGVSWVLTAYNVAVAVAALALVLFVHRLAAKYVLASGLVLFLAASVACSSAGSLEFLIAARCVQGVGAALLLAGSLPVLVALTGSTTAGATVWTISGTFGAALGPALGGVLTQAFDWRAIFIAQAPAA